MLGFHKVGGTFSCGHWVSVAIRMITVILFFVYYSFRIADCGKMKYFGSISNPHG